MKSDIELHVALAYLVIVGPPPTPRPPEPPPNYSAFLTTVRRRASYVAIHGAKNYLRALLEDPPKPTEAHIKFLRNYQAVRKNHTAASLAKNISMPAGRIRDILAVARGEHVAHGHRAPPTQDEIDDVRQAAVELIIDLDPAPPPPPQKEELPSNPPQNATAIIRHVAKTLTAIQDPPHPRRVEWPDNAEECLLYAAGRPDLLLNRRYETARELGISKRTLQRRLETLKLGRTEANVAPLLPVGIGIHGG